MHELIKIKCINLKINENFSIKFSFEIENCKINLMLFLKTQ
jgi:hypothetical protein